ncbi:MAG: hypothetical protein GOU99_02790 [Candidatus Altiarchaeota archaeon]|nr:hypothetical protein [Candidatus Altiarchaeota archaeon]
MARIVLWTGKASVARVFLAPSSVSPQTLKQIKQRFEIYLAYVSAKTDSNVFLKKAFKTRDGSHFALIAIETDKYIEASRIAENVEKKMRAIGDEVDKSINIAIHAL